MIQRLSLPSREAGDARPAVAVIQKRLERTKTATCYRWLQLVTVCFVLAAIARLALIGRPSFIQFAFAGSFFVLAATRPRLSRLIKSVLAAAVFAGLYFLSGGAALLAVPDAWWAVPSAFLGLGAIAILCQEGFWSDDPLSRADRDLLWTTILTPIVCLISSVAISAASGFVPLTRDASLYWFDQGLGYQPSFEVGRWFAANPQLAQICATVYNMLPMWMTLLFVLQMLRPRPELEDVRLSMICLGIAGFLLYAICPAAGPIHYFRDNFPWHEMRITAGMVVPVAVEDVPRNAMPSLHVGWALLMFYHSFRWGSIWRVIYALVLALTALATLGSGEHYLIDLVVAASLTLAVQAATAARLHRAALIFGAGLAVAWPATLRSTVWQTNLMAIGWTIAALTIALSVAWSMRIALATRAVRHVGSSPVMPVPRASFRFKPPGSDGGATRLVSASARTGS